MEKVFDVMVKNVLCGTILKGHIQDVTMMLVSLLCLFPTLRSPWNTTLVWRILPQTSCMSGLWAAMTLCIMFGAPSERPQCCWCTREVKTALCMSTGPSFSLPLLPEQFVLSLPEVSCILQQWFLPRCFWQRDGSWGESENCGSAGWQGDNTGREQQALLTCPKDRCYSSGICIILPLSLYP